MKSDLLSDQSRIWVLTPLFVRFLAGGNHSAIVSRPAHSALGRSFVFNTAPQINSISLDSFKLTCQQQLAHCAQCLSGVNGSCDIQERWIRGGYTGGRRRHGSDDWAHHRHFCPTSNLTHFIQHNKPLNNMTAYDISHNPGLKVPTNTFSVRKFVGFQILVRI